MTDVLDMERMMRFKRIRDDLLKKRDETQLLVNVIRKRLIDSEQALRELDHQIGKATRGLRRAEKPLSAYIAEVVEADDAGRGYFRQVLAEANARKNRDILEATGALNRGHLSAKAIANHQS